MPMKDFFRSTPLAPLFEAARLVAVDVGARGGMDTGLLPAAWAVDAVGFECDPRAHAPLLGAPAGPWRSLVHLPQAVSGTDGPRRLNVTADPTGSSLLEHDPAFGERFGLNHLFTVERAETVDTVTLDAVAARLDLLPFRYLKLDVEGAELEILEGAPQTLTGLVAIKLEAAFMPFRKGQPLAWDLAAYLGARGFALLDVVDLHRWRRTPVAHDPCVAAGDAGYSRGRVAQCDLVFVREPDALDAGTVIAAAAAALALGFFDHAREILETPAGRLWTADAGIDVPAHLGKASRAFGRRRAWSEMRARVRGLVPLLRSLGPGVPS